MKKIDLEEENLETLKLRCRLFLNPQEGQFHGSWIKDSSVKDRDLYFGSFNIVALDDGENYNVGSELERTIEGRKINYKLSFDDLDNQKLDDQSYRPLRTLGHKVFNQN